MPKPTFGLCNQRSPVDIDKLNFQRHLKAMAFGTYARFHGAVVRLHRWKLSAVNHEKYIQSKIAEASRDFDFHTLATAILHRTITIEHFLTCRHKYQGAIGDCRAKWPEGNGPPGDEPDESQTQRNGDACPGDVR